MATVCFYFQLHLPYRLRRYSVFDTDRNYFDDQKTAEIIRKLARRSYLPANRALLDTIRSSNHQFRVAFSITGSALEQFEHYVPELIDSFQHLAQTGCVEFLDETYYHSLAFLYSRDEFRAQVDMHRAKIKTLFNQEPRIFRNTELIYSNDTAQFVSHMGYDGILAEGADHILGDRSPNFLYSPPHASKLKVLLRNYRLSDDIAYRFSNKQWEQYPLTVDKFAQWVGQIDGHGQLCNLFMDYQAFGEHHWNETGIFDFIKHLPAAVLAGAKHDFLTPSQVIDRYSSAGELDVPQPFSWAAGERDLSSWLGNAMQSNASHELYKLEKPLKQKGDESLLAAWRKLTCSDHVYYMNTKHWSDTGLPHGDSPYESPYDSYINFMNVLDNIQSRARA